MTKKRVWLTQQAIWDIDFTGRESMPLACAYLKSTADADERIRSEMDLRIFNFGGGATALSIIDQMFFDELPDIVGCSIFGWNYNLYGRVVETYRQLNPNGWVVWGGTHVINQAEGIFRNFPAVDIVVNGEGEFTFRELLRSYLAERSKYELHDIEGISFKTPDGEIHTTPERSRIANLDDIPSPFLSGAMELVGDRGEFKYDVALIETNRGCPYKCSFCFWGGAIGTKVRAFSMDRLKEEIGLFGSLGVVNICLCDANFGMLKQDMEFVDLLIETRERHGYPREVVTSWAKNKSKVFYDIVSRMKETGLHSSYTLALQTLSDEGLNLMGRKNMKVNDWESLAAWLQEEGFDIYGELIWGCPGETFESFLEGYDKLAATVTRIAAYPHLLLPNTDYSNNRDAYGFVTWRGGKDDFEYVISHNTMSIEDNRRMHRFLFWARIIAEYMILRYIWVPLRMLAGITQSQVLLSLDRWLDEQDSPVAERMRACRAEVVDHFDAYAIESGLYSFFEEPQMGELFERWWEEDIIPQVVPEHAAFFRDLLRFDWATLPVLHREADGDGHQPPPGLEILEISQEPFYLRRKVHMEHDIPHLVDQVKVGEPLDLSIQPHDVDLYYKSGFCNYISNHEFYSQYVGKTLQMLHDEERYLTRSPGDARRRVGLPQDESGRGDGLVHQEAVHPVPSAKSRS